MSIEVQVRLVISDIKNMAEQGLITPYELDWCLFAIRNRHGLTRPTRHQLRDTVRAILNKAAQRSAK